MTESKIPRYALHIGIVGGPGTASDLHRMAALPGVIGVHQNGDNFHEWGESFPAQDLYSVAGVSSHLLLEVRASTDPQAVFEGVRQVLHSRVLCTAENLDHTQSEGLPKNTKPYVVTDWDDWSQPFIDPQDRLAEILIDQWGGVVGHSLLTEIAKEASIHVSEQIADDLPSYDLVVSLGFNPDCDSYVTWQQVAEKLLEEQDDTGGKTIRTGLDLDEIERALYQIGFDRELPYWAERQSDLDATCTWLYSLRDHLQAKHAHSTQERTN